jgi:hypothetical protein
MTVKPVDCLLDRRGMKVMNKETVGYNPDPVTLIGEFPEILPGTRYHIHAAEKFSLSHGKTMQAVILAFIRYTPFGQSVGNIDRKCLKRTLEPFCGDHSHPSVKIGTDSIKIDTDD